MKSFLSLLFFVCSSSVLSAQDISGNWKGRIDVNGNPLPIVFHFKQDPSGKIDGTWDSPSQNARGLQFSSIHVAGDSIHLGVALVDGSYRGKFTGKDSIEGIWEQRGNELPLDFGRATGDEETVNSDVPYPGEREIVITSAGGSPLYGTLLSKNNTQKIAILIAGSGPTDRNGNSTIAPKTNELEMLAHALDSQGIATFRYDKRGIAKSTAPGAKEGDLVFDDYVRDAGKIFDYLHDTLGFRNIYFIGHSEGSLIGMLASRKKKVKGYISVAGAGRPIDVVLNEQLQKQPLPDSVKKQIPPIFDQLRAGQEVTNFPRSLAMLFRKSIQPYLISWLKYSPEKEIAGLKCPILILQGSCDIQVMAVDAENLHRGNKKSQLDMIPYMTHTLKNAGKDCANEKKTYTDASMPLDRTLVKDIAEFIRK